MIEIVYGDYMTAEPWPLLLLLVVVAVIVWIREREKP